MKILFIIFQYIIPQHTLSRLVGYLAETEIVWLKNLLITQFIKHYGVNMAEAADPEPLNYKNFNAFFTRALAEGARPISEDDNTLACPADGAISQLGEIKNNQIFQAKGQHYSTEQLLADEEAAKLYRNGSFATIYLSPKDYHRVHMPLSAKLTKMTYVPGKLFSVNQTTAENVPGVFARNERLVCHFETEHGPMTLVLVGAMIVAGIETVWSGQVAPPTGPQNTLYTATPKAVSLNKGEEMGRFKLGSTAILLFPEGTVVWKETLEAGSPTTMGELLGTIESVITS